MDTPTDMAEWLDWKDRYVDHVGENGWRIRTCRNTMHSVVDIDNLRDKLRDDGRRTLEDLLRADTFVRSDGRLWLLEPVAKHLVLTLAGLKALGELFSDLHEARNEAVRTLMAEQSQVLAWIRQVQQRTLKVLEEDLSHRVPKVVN